MVTYTQAELKELIPICDELNLSNTKKILETIKFDSNLFFDFLTHAADGATCWKSEEGNFEMEIQGISDTAKQFHRALLELIYEVENYQLPKYINTDKKLEPFFLWRLDIKK